MVDSSPVSLRYYAAVSKRRRSSAWMTTGQAASHIPPIQQFTLRQVLHTVNSANFRRPVVWLREEYTWLREIWPREVWLREEYTWWKALGEVLLANWRMRGCNGEGWADPATAVAVCISLRCAAPQGVPPWEYRCNRSALTNVAEWSDCTREFITDGEVNHRNARAFNHAYADGVECA